MGTFSCPPHAPSESRLDQTISSSFDIVPALSLLDRIQLLHNLSAFTPPTAPLQYLGSQVDGTGLCSTRRVHHDGCDLRRQLVAEDPRSSESRFSRRSNPSTRLAICGLLVRKLPRPPSRLSLASPSAWKTSCLHSKRPMHGRESCDASPLRSCRNQTPLLICSWYKTGQNSMHIPDPITSFGRFLLISHNISRCSVGSPRFHLLPCCEVSRRSWMSPFTSREKSPSAGGFYWSLSTPPPKTF